MPDVESLSDTLRQMITGFARTQELYTFVKLGIADQLAKGPAASFKLAQEVKVHPQSLHRFLRKMVVNNLVVQDANGSFRLLPMGELLRADHPDSLRNLVLFIGEIHYSADQGLLYAVETGQPAFDYVFGMPFFDYLAKNQRVSTLFDDLMNEGIANNISGLISAYDFSHVELLVDIGSGTGALITYIMIAYPRIHGIIFDLPHVVAKAEDFLYANGVADRCRIVSGDFLRDNFPKGGDTYIMSNIIHDWDDDRALEILRKCCKAMDIDSKLLIVEEIMPERVEDAPATIGSDISMLKLTGGRERTIEEYKHIIGEAGFQLARIIEFEPAGTFLGRKQNWAIIECKLL